MGNGNVAVAENIRYGGNIAKLSDRRLKTNIRPLDDVLSKIRELRGVYFQWKRDSSDDIGFIAQEVEKVFPECVETGMTEELGETKFVSYVKMTPVLLEAINEQQKIIENLEAQLKNQSERTKHIEERLDAIMERLASREETM